MKKYIVLSLIALIFASSSVCTAYAKTKVSPELNNVILLYKKGNYAECYTRLNDIIKKDPANAAAYYYLAITSAQVGKKQEAIDNYEKVISLSPGGSIETYAIKGKRCLETPSSCNEESGVETTELDEFIKKKFGSGFSEKARSQYEKLKIENMMREMDRNSDIAPQRFKEYKDFSTMNGKPTNDEIVAALRVLQQAGFSNMIGNSSNDFSLLTNTANNNNSIYNLLGNNTNSLSPQVIQALLTNQMSTGF